MYLGLLPARYKVFGVIKHGDLKESHVVHCSLILKENNPTWWQRIVPSVRKFKEKRKERQHGERRRD